MAQQPFSEATARSTARRGVAVLTSGLACLGLASVVAVTAADASDPSTSAAKAPTCESGEVLARAYIPAGPTFSSSYTNEGIEKRYNCLSPANDIQVRRYDVGRYLVRLPGFPTTGGKIISSVDLITARTTFGHTGIPTQLAFGATSYTTTIDGQRTLMLVCAKNPGTGMVLSDSCGFSLTVFSK